MAVLRQMLREDLSVGFFPRQQPPPQNEIHTKRILSATAGRADFARGRNQFESPADTREFDQLSYAALNLLNGDWRQQRVEHFCFLENCCDGHKVDVCVERCTALLAELVFNRLGEKVPAANRWHTLAPTLCSQSLGLFCHGVLRRVIHGCAFGSYDDQLQAEHPEGSAMAFQAYVTHKHRTAADFFTDYPHNAQLLGIAVVVTEAVDKLSARLQHLDHHSCSAQEHRRTPFPNLIC